MLPSGASDAVLVIDKAGFISHWNPGSLDADGIVSEVESAGAGGGRNPLDLLGLLFTTGAFIPLVFFALHESVSNLQKLHRFQVQDFSEQLEQVDSDSR